MTTTISTQTQNFHIIKVSYKGATNTNGSRVVMRSDRFQQSETIGYDHNYNNIYEMAENWLSANGFELVGHGEGKDCYYVITSTFKPLKN